MYTGTLYKSSLLDRQKQRQGQRQTQTDTRTEADRQTDTCLEEEEKGQ